MKAYLITTSVLFGLVTVAHVWRMIAESRALLSDPWFILLTLGTAAMCIWGLRLLRAPLSPAR